MYPEYPQDALERGISGTVVIDITVNAAGDVTTAAVAERTPGIARVCFQGRARVEIHTELSRRPPMNIAFEYTLTGTSWGVRMIGDALSSVGPRFHGDTKRRLRGEGAIPKS